MKIVQIYQIAKVPIVFSLSPVERGGLVLKHAYDEQDVKESDPFVFVYALPKLPFVGGMLHTNWSKEDKLRAKDIRAYSIPYNVFLGGWYCNRLFSLSPPTSSTKSALRRARLAEKKGESLLQSIKGMTHLQVAWVYGWPMEREPLSLTLKRTSWDYGRTTIDFRNGRVISVFQHMPH